MAGLVLITIAVMALLNGMVQLRGADAGTGWALLACSATALVGFYFHQRRGARPLMELRLFGFRNFALGGVVAFIYGMALFGSTYLVPVFMQIALHLPPSQAGAALLPAGFALAFTIPLAGRLTDRLPFGRIVAFGLTLLAASFLLMILRRAGELAVVDRRLGRGSAASASASCCRRSTSARCAACRRSSSRRAPAPSTSCARSAARSASAWSASCLRGA